MSLPSNSNKCLTKNLLHLFCVEIILVFIANLNIKPWHWKYFFLHVETFFVVYMTLPYVITMRFMKTMNRWLWDILTLFDITCKSMLPFVIIILLDWKTLTLFVVDDTGSRDSSFCPGLPWTICVCPGGTSWSHWSRFHKRRCRRKSRRRGSSWSREKSCWNSRRQNTIFWLLPNFSPLRWFYLWKIQL